MNLRVVVEIEPGPYATGGHASPAASSEEAPDRWDAYWRACLADRGVVLDPIAPGSWFVDLASLARSPALGTVLELEGGLDGAEALEDVAALSGGVAFEIDGAIVLQPQCCGDLESVSEWQRILDERPAEWTQVWIGHPWVFARERDGVVDVSQLVETEAPFVAFSIPRDVLERALVTARATLVGAVPRFAEVLGCRRLDATALATTLLGLRTRERWDEARVSG